GLSGDVTLPAVIGPVLVGHAEPGGPDVLFPDEQRVAEPVADAAEGRARPDTDDAVGVDDVAVGVIFEVRRAGHEAGTDHGPPGIPRVAGITVPVAAGGVPRVSWHPAAR